MLPPFSLCGICGRTKALPYDTKFLNRDVIIFILFEFTFSSERDIILYTYFVLSGRSGGL